jgi:hypothetical protein
MSTAVPAQFVFTASPNSPLLSGFRINVDGSLAPIPGSPFLINTSARAIAGVHGTLLVADGAGIRVFSVDKETGAIRQSDSARIGAITDLLSDLHSDAAIAVSPTGAMVLRVKDGKLQAQPAPMSPGSAEAQTSRQSIVDAADHFMYVVDAGKAELMAFRIENAKPLPLTPQSYPLPRGTAFITLVESRNIRR